VPRPRNCVRDGTSEAADARLYVVTVPDVAPATVAGRCLASGPHIRDIWFRSARDHLSAATRGSGERSLREFVNDYSADVNVPFYIATRSLDGAIEDRLPAATEPLMHRQAGKRLAYSRGADDAARKARTVRCLAARTGETDQEILGGMSGNATS
jgi:hypothetical protein